MQPFGRSVESRTVGRCEQAPDDSRAYTAELDDRDHGSSDIDTSPALRFVGVPSTLSARLIEAAPGKRIVSGVQIGVYVHERRNEEAGRAGRHGLVVRSKASLRAERAMPLRTLGTAVLQETATGQSSPLVPRTQPPTRGSCQGEGAVPDHPRQIADGVGRCAQI